MEAYFILLPAALSALGAYLLGRRRGLPAAGLPPALARTLECVGLAVFFIVLNIALGALLTLLARALTRRFVSLHAVTDSVLMGLSVLEAVALRWWWAGAGNRQERPPPAQEVVRS